MRTAKTGKAFVTALLRSDSLGETLWVNAVAFDEAAQAERPERAYLSKAS
jgi:hypothetical protein